MTRACHALTHTLAIHNQRAAQALETLDVHRYARDQSDKRGPAYLRPPPERRHSRRAQNCWKTEIMHLDGLGSPFGRHSRLPFGPSSLISRTSWSFRLSES